MKALTVVAIATLIALAAAPSASAAEAGDLRLNLSITWDLGVRVGVGYRLSDRLGVQADLGSSLFVLEGAFMLTGDLFVTYDLLPSDGPFGLRIMAGVPDWRTVFIDPPAAEIAFGASLEAGYEFDGPWGVFLRAGAGLPIFLENGVLERRSTSYPLGLWPDLTAGAKLTLR